MPSGYQLLLGGQPADQDLLTLLTSLNVDESMDLPGAVQLEVPLSPGPGGEYTYVNDPRFAPLASVAVVATAGGGDDFLGSSPVGQCIFDGYILSQKLHLESGATRSKLTVWGQDSSWLMNLQEKTREWPDLSDADVAAAIFDEYGIAPAIENYDEDSPAHTEDGHSLMQRGSDIQFLRNLARRNGKLCRIVCDEVPGLRIGYFAPPNLQGPPQVRMILNDPETWNVAAVDLEWDATRPTGVIARQALFTDPDPGAGTGDARESGLPLLGDLSLEDFTGEPMVVLLTAPVDDAGELSMRAQAVLREADWFVRCVGEADVERLGAVLRAGMLVSLEGVGQVHSGVYLVWSVRHRITRQAHTMKFTLVRNAVGSSPGFGPPGLTPPGGGFGGV